MLKRDDGRYQGRTQLLVRFGYDGARFRGLQPQRDQPTAGAALRARFTAAGADPRGLNFAARTDAGVHAERNVATCFLRGVAEIEPILAAVAAPRDDGLFAVEAARVPIHVHARASSRGKHYRYVLEPGAVGVDRQPPRAWRIAPELDTDRMAAAAALLVGEHDFTSFRSPRCGAGVTVKTLNAIDIWRDGPRVVVDVRGQSFLRQMVRIMIGTLAEIGAGLREPGAIPAILSARSRHAAGLTAPAHGLTLVDVSIVVS